MTYLVGGKLKFDLSGIGEGFLLGRSSSSIVESNSTFLSASLVGRIKGLNMNRLNRIGPIIGILKGQQWLSSGSCPFLAVRLLQ
jgi:hypothetical protein